MLSRFSRILLVDDSTTARRMIRAMLEQLGHVNIDEASDGAAAFAKLEQRHHALVVSDWFMEPMSGLQLLMKMRRSPRWERTPFIMVTVRAQKKFMDTARDEGATHFLPKPFTCRELDERLAAIKGSLLPRPTPVTVAVQRRVLA